jgi:hypothetical protein
MELNVAGVQRGRIGRGVLDATALRWRAARLFFFFFFFFVDGMGAS